MASVDVNALFARAEQRFAAGRLDLARADLGQLRRLAGEHPAVLHLLALVEKKRGDLLAARAAFEAALRHAPADAQILNNYANLLDAAGEPLAALDRYGQALAAAPRLVDARYNRALLLQRLGRLDEALADLDQAADYNPASAKTHSARGSVLTALGKVDEAAAAFDRALALEPGRAVALHGRARIALERGEADAADRYRRALERQPDDPELLIGLAEALEADGDPGGLALLHDALRRRPDWTLGQETLSRMRSEAGEQDFARSYREALAGEAGNRKLHIGYWRTLAKATRYPEALAALRSAKSHLPTDREILLSEAVFASHAGELDAADRLFSELGDDPDVREAKARHKLRRHDPAAAAALLERVVQEQPDSIPAWANLGIAWRLLGDSRHAWLCEQPGLVSTRDLGLSAAELERMAALLRGLHRTHAHPIGQSLRGGTQTRGRLFLRAEPEIAALRERIRAGVADHLAGLPRADPNHPLLRHRDRRFEFDGSWSVRLTSSGFHIAHIHPRGRLSSACYLAIPEAQHRRNSKDGWLEIGRPPADLQLDVPPLLTIEPRPGRLALFPSYLYHGTVPFDAGERLSVAFDMVPA